jgi:hypothetical protein
MLVTAVMVFLVLWMGKGMLGTVTSLTSSVPLVGQVLQVIGLVYVVKWALGNPAVVRNSTAVLRNSTSWLSTVTPEPSPAPTKPPITEPPTKPPMPPQTPTQAPTVAPSGLSFLLPAMF